MNQSSQLSDNRVARRRQDACNRVIEAASILFARRGFFETSMAAIAAEADVAVGTLYNLFPNKEGLYRELINTKARAFHTRLSPLLERKGSVIERLDGWLSAKLALFLDEAGFIRLFFSVTGTRTMPVRKGLPETARALYADGLRQLAALIEEGIGQGVFVRINPYRAAVMVQSVSNDLLLLHLDDAATHPAEAVMNDVRRITFGALLETQQRTGGDEPPRWNGSDSQEAGRSKP